MKAKTKPVIGIIGAGRLGTAVATAALKAKYQVNIANSRDPETLTLILQVLLPGAHADTVSNVILLSDIIVLAIPRTKFKNFSSNLFDNKIVIDAMNYWQTTEGYVEELANGKVSTSEDIQKKLAKAYIVKTLNHIAYNELIEHSLPAGSPNRRAIALAGDHSEAKKRVATFINDIGFDPVDLGNLFEGKHFQPDTPLFNTRYSAEELQKMNK